MSTLKSGADLDAHLAGLAGFEKSYKVNMGNAQALTETIRKMLVGRRYRCVAGPSRGPNPRATGRDREPSEFQITGVRLQYDFVLQVKGRKVLTASRTLGHQDWDLGPFIRSRLLP